MDTSKKGCLVNVLLFGLGAVLGTGLTAVAAVVLFLPTTRTVDARPPTADLPGAYVKQDGSDYEVWLGPSEDHGHVVPIPAGWGHDPRLTRADGGVELEFGNGGRIFVPESAYAGGR
ncbi:hypothetical protein [Actinosynnema sp. NPDC020468]|uniref:hypothetical protein n=1 Tax=Actinosynnema sp. NPDC020468 TaxID=3154488 RepID=UPI00340A8601